MQMRDEYPKCSCGCQIELTEINGNYLCYKCMKELKKCTKIINSVLRTDKNFKRRGRR